MRPRTPPEGVVHSDQSGADTRLILIVALGLLTVLGVLAIDFDQDGLEDTWEVQYGFSTNAYSASNLRGWWQLNTNAGTSAADRSTNNRALTLTSGTWTNGLFSNATHFNGSSTYFSASTANPQIYNITNFTFSAWIRTTNGATNRAVVRWTNASGKGWQIHSIQNGRLQARFDTSTSNNQQVTNTSGSPILINDNQWHHVALTCSNGAAKLYIDGLLEGQKTITGSFSGNPREFRIGRGWSNFWFGRIDEIRFYDRPLASNEIYLLPNTYADVDGDGWSNLTEYQQGTNPLVADTDGDGLLDGSDSYPLDYYNNSAPTLSIIAGNDQIGTTNAFLTLPLVVQVKNTNNIALTNAPVNFLVSSGGGGLATNHTDTAVSSLNVRSTNNGYASANFKTPANYDASCQIVATAQTGTNTIQVTFGERTHHSGKLSGGYYHGLAVKSDRTAWAWGQNNIYQLGNSTNLNYWYPLQIPGFTDVVDAAAGTSYSLILRSDGNVWGIGNNGASQLGDATTINRTQWVQTSNLTGVASICAGVSGQSFAIKTNQTLWAWGNNGTGQLGLGDTTDRSTPTQVTALSNVIAVAAGNYHSVALDASGNVWTTGANNVGQQGDGTSNDRTTFTKIANFSNVVSIAAGYDHVLAAKTNGTVWAWGANFEGELGDGTTSNRNVPTQASNITNAVSVAAGNFHSMALDSTGLPWVWGYNAQGQLGDGTTTQRNSPVTNAAISGVRRIEGGGSHSMAVTADGTAYGWGYNIYGQVGNISTNNQTSPVAIHRLTLADQVTTPTFTPDGGTRTPPLSVTVSCATAGATIYYSTNGNDPTTTNSVVASGSSVSLSGAKIFKARAYKSGLAPSHVKSAAYNVYNGRLANGTFHSLAMFSDNTVWAWGSNDSGQLGTGNTYTYWYPTQVSITNVAEVAGARYRSFARKNDGTVWTWQTNIVQVTNITTASRVAAGEQHFMAIQTNGVLWSWGLNSSGQLGLSDDTDRTNPVQVSGSTNFVDVAGGLSFSIGLRSDGSVWAWGGASVLGDGDSNARSTPIAMGTMADVVAIAPGYEHSAVLKSDGSVWTWGNGSSGQIGDGSTSASTYPKRVSALTNVVAIYPARFGGIAQKADGTFWVWGDNSKGALADLTTTQRNSPIQMTNITSVAAINSSWDWSLAIKSDGTIWSTGGNTLGQLGDETFTNRSYYALVHVFDSDADGLEDWEEAGAGSDLFATDSNGDGIEDGISFHAGIDPADTDLDDDGLTNAEELALGTDMFDDDTDGDGTEDGDDDFPLDPLRTTAPSSNPSDTTAPTITLDEPTNATLL